MGPDIMSTGFAGAAAANTQIGDTAAVVVQGRFGRCASAGARLGGATTIIAVDTILERPAMAKRPGADEVVDFE